MVDREDLRWWWDLAPSLKWTRAKTMPDVPHWYIVHGRTPGLDRADFVRIARVVRTFGEPGKFYRRSNLYLFTEDRRLKFWCIYNRPPVDEEINIVNVAMAHLVYGRQADFHREWLAELALPPGRDLGI